MGKKVEDLEREKIFMPFDALKGFRQALVEKEQQVEPQRDLTEEQQIKLSIVVNKIKKRDIVSVQFYCVNKYVWLTGCVEQINCTLKFFVVDGQKILFNQISEIEIK